VRQQRGLALVGLVFAAYFGFQFGGGHELLLGVFAFIALLIAFPAILRAQSRRSMRRLYGASTNPCLRGLHRLEARVDGLAHSCAAGAGVTAWSAVASISETKRHAILVYSGGAGVAIPRDRLHSGSLPAFVATVRRHLSAPGA
jgi:hypothetical protein